MGSIFSVGIELLVIGLSVVFFVLLLLMFIMQIMSSVINKAEKKLQPQAEQVVNKQVTLVNDTPDEELAAVMAVMSYILPKQETPVHLNIVEVKN